MTIDQALIILSAFCLAATVVATFAASQAWPGLISKAAFRCVVLWFASGCALAWLAVWLVS